MLAVMLAMFPLAGCSGSSAEVSPAPAESSEPVASTAPEASFLADPLFDTDEYLPDYDTDCGYRNVYATEGYCETETTIYGVWGDQICFWDKQTGISGPLCGKPECDHLPSNVDCNAYWSGGSPRLSVYDGKLYFVGGDVNEPGSDYIWRMNTDGTERQRLRRVGDRPDGSYGNNLVMFHRGYVYFSGMINTVTEGEPADRLYIYAEKIDTGEKVEIQDRTGHAGERMAYAIQWKGNNFYILTYVSDFGNSANNSVNRSFEILRWNAKTHVMDTLYSVEGGTMLPKDLGVSEDGKTLYLRGTADFGTDECAPALYELDIESGTLTRSFTVDGFKNYSAFVYNNLYVIALVKTEAVDDGDKYRGMLIKDLDSGSVLYEGMGLPEGIDAKDVTLVTYGGGSSECILSRLSLGNREDVVVCLTLGDEPEARVVHEVRY